MGSQKQIVIHCGFHKTASSSIQYSLADNRKKLKKLGYYYPEMRFDNKLFYNQSIPLYGLFTTHPEKFQHYVIHNQFDPTQVNKKIKALLDENCFRYDRLIFSDEFISSLNKDELVKLKKHFETLGFDIRIITFVRDPCNLFTSQIQQRIPSNTIQTMLDAVDKVQGSHSKVSRLMAVFGSAVEFHCFEKACQFEGGPAAYFFNLLALKRNVSFKYKSVNESRSNHAVRLISYINENKGKQIFRRQDLFDLYEIKGNKFVLNKSEMAQVETSLVDARNKVADILGDDFFLPINFSSRDDLAWKKQQLSTVISLIPKLKKPIALLIYFYFLQEKTVSPDQLEKIEICINKTFPNTVNPGEKSVIRNKAKTKRFRKLILHVGPDKTGSTAIQKNLDGNRETLLKQGVFYPEGNTTTGGTHRHHVLGSCFTQRENLFDYNAAFNREQHLELILERDNNYLTYLTNELNTVEAEVLVLSCEGFAYLTETACRGLQQFLSAYCDEIEVVFYVRAPLSYAISRCSQQVKQGKNGFVDLDTAHMPFKTILQKFADVYGKENLNLRMFDRTKLIEGDVVLDFLSLLAIPHSALEELTRLGTQKNPSLSEPAILIGNRMVELLDGFIPSGAEFKTTKQRGIGDKFLPRIKGQKLRLSQTEQESILTLSKPHLDYLKNEFSIQLKPEGVTTRDDSNDLSQQVINFAARVLINVLVPDFDLNTGTRRDVITNVQNEDNGRSATESIVSIHRPKTSKFKKVILHIGPDKTGSTSIQKTLDAGRELLLQQGVFIGPNGKQAILGSCMSPEPREFEYNRLHSQGMNDQAIQKRDSHYITSLRKQLSETQADILVLSAEGFAYLPELAFARFKEFLSEYCEEIEIVLYIREPLSFAKSAMSQRVKTGERAWEGISVPILPYRSIIENLLAVFDKKQLNLRLFARESLPKGNVVLDFLSLLDLPKGVQGKLEQLTPSENSSLTQEGLLVGDRMIELLDGFLSFGPEFSKKTGIGKVFLPRIQGQKIRLTGSQTKVILSSSKSHTDYLEQEFGLHLQSEQNQIEGQAPLTGDMIDFSARTLLNVLVPDFEVTTNLPNVVEQKKSISKRIAGLKLNAKRNFYLFVAEHKHHLDSYPKLRRYVKSIWVKSGLNKK